MAKYLQMKNRRDAGFNYYNFIVCQVCLHIYDYIKCHRMYLFLRLVERSGVANRCRFWATNLPESHFIEKVYIMADI